MYTPELGVGFRGWEEVCKEEQHIYREKEERKREWDKKKQIKREKPRHCMQLRHFCSVPDVHQLLCCSKDSIHCQWFWEEIHSELWRTDGVRWRNIIWWEVEKELFNMKHEQFKSQLGTHNQQASSNRIQDNSGAFRRKGLSLQCVWGHWGCFWGGS